MTRTEPYLIRLNEHLAQLSIPERKPFIIRQRENWEARYLAFQLDIGHDGEPDGDSTAWDYAETIGALEKLEATL